MLLPMREFDWSYELGMYGGIAGGVLVVILVVSGLVLLIRYLVRSSRL